MEYLFMFMVMTLLFSVFLALPTYTIVVGFRRLGSKPLWVKAAMSLGFLTLILFFIHTPSNARYTQYFEHYTDLKLPRSAVLIDAHRSALNPDNSEQISALFELSEADFSEFFSQTNIHESTRCEKDASLLIIEHAALECWTLDKSQQPTVSWRLLSDNRTLLFDYYHR